jgi:hypothetical protein
VDEAGDQVAAESEEDHDPGNRRERQSRRVSVAGDDQCNGKSSERI